MSLENILNKIVSEGQAEAARLHAEAEARSFALKQQGQVDADTRRQQILEQAENEAHEYELPLLSVAKLEARKSRLLAQQEAVQSCFDLALNELRSLPLEESQSLLRRLLLESAVTGNEQIAVEAQDRVIYSDDFLSSVNGALKQSGKQGALTLAEQPRATGGGFMLLAGEIEINATYPALIKSVREDLEPEVARILFQ